MRSPIIIYSAAVVLFIIITLVMIGKLAHDDTKDAPVWYEAGRRVLAGESLMEIKGYRYPPTFAVLISPLCVLPFPVYFYLLYGINVALFILSIYLAVRIVAAYETRQATVERFWLPILLMLVFAVDNFFLGQTNILVMALIYWTFLELLRRREWLAGWPLGAAIAIKAFPALILAYLVYRLKFRAAVAAILSLTFFLLILPGPVRGFQRNWEEVSYWAERVVMPYLSRGEAGDWGQHALDLGNQSLQAVHHRYLTGVDANVAARRGAPIHVNFTRLTESQVNYVVAAGFLLLVLVFVVSCGWRPPKFPKGLAVEYSLVVILVLLTSAISWTYFFVILLLPVIVIYTLLDDNNLRQFTRVALQFSLGALILAIILLVSLYARALGSLCWATIIMYVALCLACRDLRQSVSANPSIALHD